MSMGAKEMSEAGQGGVWAGCGLLVPLAARRRRAYPRGGPPTATKSSARGPSRRPPCGNCVTTFHPLPLPPNA